jgi:hypothetical protein
MDYNACAATGDNSFVSIQAAKDARHNGERGSLIALWSLTAAGLALGIAAFIIG